MVSEGGSTANKGCIEEEGRRSKVSNLNEQCAVVYMTISSEDGSYRQTPEIMKPSELKPESPLHPLPYYMSSIWINRSSGTSLLNIANNRFVSKTSIRKELSYQNFDRTYPSICNDLQSASPVRDAIESGTLTP